MSDPFRMSARISDMETSVVREVVTRAGIAATTVTTMEGGWASWTFDINGEWIVRFARTAEVAESHERELRLLPELARTMSCRIPLPEFDGTWNGIRYLGYRKIIGRPFGRGDNWHALIAILRELHGFPSDEANQLLRIDGTVDEWRRRFATLRDEMDREVLPLLDSATGRTFVERYDKFLDSTMDFTPVLVHCDLGSEHILVDPDTGTPVGLLDFEDATVGDPAIDFVGLLITLGEPGVRDMIAAYGAPVSWERLWFYWTLGSAHAVLHGVRTNDAFVVQDGLAGLRQRL